MIASAGGATRSPRSVISLSTQHADRTIQIATIPSAAPWRDRTGCFEPI